MTTPWTTDGGIHRIPLPIDSGGLWLCGKHYIAPRVEEVREELGQPIVVCLTQRHELEDRYDSYITWLEAHHGTNALWFPIHDLNAPPIDRGLDLLERLTDGLRRDERFIVHCAAGIGRAGTTAVGVLMMLGMEEDLATSHVRAHRPMAGPEAGSQREFISALAQTLAQR
jgi:protein-tyrosine phosphatase